MGKRKHSRREYEYEDIYKKIRKLERKLERYRSSSPSPDHDRSDYSVYASDLEEYPNVRGDDNNEDAIDTYNEYQAESTGLVARPLAPAPSAEPVAGPSTSVPLAEPVAGTSTLLVAPATTPTTLNGLSTVNQENSDVNNITSLDPDILALLGDDPTKEKNFGENLHIDIASRWTYILANGLSKDNRLELSNCYLPAENCPNMRAPKLNLEIKAALMEINIKKDLYSQSKQNQLASSLAAIGRTLNWALLSNNTVPQDILKCLSDAGRLICDSHYRESQSRRYAALSTLNKDIRDTVKNTNIDEHLFGSALSDHIKSSKAITKTGSEMKQKVQRPAFRAPVTTLSRGALNSRGAPPRVASAVVQRSTPTFRRPQRDRRQEAPRGRRRPTNNPRQQTRRR